MPARKVCQTFFRNALASTHQYRQNAIIDSAAALVGGTSLSLTSIVSGLSEKLKKLAQQNALLERRVRELEEKQKES